MLQDKIYPTTARFLARLHQNFDDFPINSVSKLWLEMTKVSTKLLSEFCEKRKENYFLKFNWDSPTNEQIK